MVLSETDFNMPWNTLKDSVTLETKNAWGISIMEPTWLLVLFYILQIIVILGFEASNRNTNVMFLNYS